MRRDIYCRFLLSLWRTDLPYSLKLFSVRALSHSEKAILKLFSKLLSVNRPYVEICNLFSGLAVSQHILFSFVKIYIAPAFGRYENKIFKTPAGFYFSFLLVRPKRPRPEIQS